MRSAESGDVQLAVTVCKTLNRTLLSECSQGMSSPKAANRRRKKWKADLKKFAIKANKMERVVKRILRELFNLPSAARSGS